MELVKIKSFKESELKKITASIIKDVENGNVNPLEKYIEAKALEVIIKDVIENLKSKAKNEADDYSKIDSTFNGAKFSIGNSGDTLDYECDAEYLKIKEELEDRKDTLKTAYKLSLKDKKSIDELTGEIIPVVPVKKHSEQIIKVSFK